VSALIWIAATLIAAGAQTARNAMQRSLTDAIGVMGATQVRFIFGFPFALLFLAAACLAAARLPPAMTHQAFLWCLIGALSQIAATALMLSAMRQASFAVTTACTKTEPVQAALFGAAVLGDALTPLKLGAVLLATAGVLLMSLKPGVSLRKAGLGPLMLGIASGGLFGLAAVGFRGAILALPEGVFFLRASTILVWGLGLQALLLGLYLMAADRPALTGSFRVWRPSLLAGFLGAFASQFWFIGFSLTAVANVRTLALVEVFMAQAAARRLFSETMSRREQLGMVMIVAGVGIILWLAV
jgi:drug/metabolite transporter (DMT)-like permease